MTDLHQWLAQDDPRLSEEVETYIARLIAEARTRAPDLCGFAILPWILDCSGPPCFIAAYCRRSDLESNHDQPMPELFYPNEWKSENQINSGGDSCLEYLSQRHREFEKLHFPEQTESLITDEFKNSYVNIFYKAILTSMKNLLSKGAFPENTFKVISFSDSDEDIILESARELNSPEIFQAFKKTF